MVGNTTHLIEQFSEFLKQNKKIKDELQKEVDDIKPVNFYECGKYEDELNYIAGCVLKKAQYKFGKDRSANGSVFYLTPDDKLEIRRYKHHRKESVYFLEDSYHRVHEGLPEEFFWCIDKIKKELRSEPNRNVRDKDKKKDIIAEFNSYAEIHQIDFWGEGITQISISEMQIIKQSDKYLINMKSKTDTDIDPFDRETILGDANILELKKCIELIKDDNSKNQKELAEINEKINRIYEEFGYLQYLVVRAI